MQMKMVEKRMLPCLSAAVNVDKPFHSVRDANPWSPNTPGHGLNNAATQGRVSPSAIYSSHMRAGVGRGGCAGKRGAINPSFSSIAPCPTFGYQFIVISSTTKPTAIPTRSVNVSNSVAALRRPVRGRPALRRALPSALLPPAPCPLPPPSALPPRTPAAAAAAAGPAPCCRPPATAPAPPTRAAASATPPPPPGRL